MVEHDLAVLDYLSDFICCLYGTPSAYGVVTMPFSVREGINVFLAGFVPTENLRFRDVTLDFKVCVFLTERKASSRRSLQRYCSSLCSVLLACLTRDGALRPLPSVRSSAASGPPILLKMLSGNGRRCYKYARSTRLTRALPISSRLSPLTSPFSCSSRPFPSPCPRSLFGCLAVINVDVKT